MIIHSLAFGGINLSNSKKRTISQILFIGLFFFLLFRGNLQIWVAFWALGIVVSLIFDRAYCGWACPMGTLLRFQSWIYDKFNLTRKKVSSRFILNSFRVILILGFLAGMIAVRRFGYRLNIILILVGGALVISFFFEESLWHRICPHGTVLSISNKFAKYRMEISEDDCTGCGLCEQACPNDIIYQVEDSKVREIDSKECLVCFECQKACPADAISYQN